MDSKVVTRELRAVVRPMLEEDQQGAHASVDIITSIRSLL